MQEESFDHEELICVKVDKVYDWIMKENTFDIFPTGEIEFHGVHPSTDLKRAFVECEVTPNRVNPVEILNREDQQFCIDGEDICLQKLTLRTNFLVTLTVVLPHGEVFKSKKIRTSRNQMVTLCAPKGTDVEITFSELDCFVMSTGKLEAHYGKIEFSDLAISIKACQSIQSTYPTTVEIVAGHCAPREDFITGCRAPVHPPECPYVFPDHKHCH